ncbi:MAG: TrkA C-terminal domain-containing protein [Lachnospiraceae bacterium]
MTVNPERTTAKEIFGLLQYPSFLKREPFAKGRAEIVALPVRAGGKLDGMVLSDLYTSLKVRVLVCAVERNKEVYIPDGSFRLEVGDHIYVTSTVQSLLQMVKWMGMETQKIRSVMLIGGSRTAVYLARMLADAGIHVKLLETKPDRCDELSADLPKTEVINADGTSINTLLTEGIEETDAVVPLTNMDEQNMVIAMYANSRRVPKVVTKINRGEYCALLPANEAECVVTPLQLTSTNILRYVRAMQNRQGEGVLTLHRLVDERVEALEFRVTQSTRYLGVALKDMPLKPNLLVALISRRDKVLVPSGSDYFAVDDTVVIVTKSDRSFNALNDIFGGGQK